MMGPSFDVFFHGSHSLRVKGPSNRVLGPKYYNIRYLGPKALLFGSLDP